MTTRFGLVRQALQTGTGTQDFVDSNMGGVTPNAAFCWVTSAKTDGVRGDNMILSYGATDGTRQWCVRQRNQDGVPTTATVQGFASNLLSVYRSWTSTPLALEATFDSFITNGIRINITTNDNDEYLLHVLLIYAPNAYANGFELNTGNDPKTEPIGFPADAVIAAGAGIAAPGSTGTSRWCLGFASRDGGSLRQHSVGVRSRNNVSTSDVVLCKQDQVIAIPEYSTATVGYAADVSFGATDITFDMDQAVGTDDIQVGYLAIQVDGGQDWSGEEQTPAGTGDWEVAGVGFQPQLVLALPTIMSLSGDRLYSAPSEPNQHGFAALVASSEYSSSLTHRDGVSTTNEASYSKNAIRLWNALGGTLYAGTGPSGAGSFDVDGFTINLTAVAGPYYWRFLALGGYVPPPPTMARERSTHRRVHGRVFSRVN